MKRPKRLLAAASANNTQTPKVFWPFSMLQDDEAGPGPAHRSKMVTFSQGSHAENGAPAMQSRRAGAPKLEKKGEPAGLDPISLNGSPRIPKRNIYKTRCNP